MRIESVSDIVENSHNLVKMIYIIDEALKARGITQQDLAKMTGIHINKVHLLAIMVALRITDVSELISVKLPSELENKCEQQWFEWISSKKLPDEVKAMFRENLLSSINLTND